MSDEYKTICRSLGKLTREQLDDVYTRITALQGLESRARALNDRDLGTERDEEFLRYVLKLNDMAHSKNVLITVRRKVGAKLVTMARKAVEDAYNSAAESPVHFGGLNYASRTWVYSWFIQAARACVLREESGLVGSALSEAIEEFGRLRGMLIDAGLHGSARQTYAIQRKLQDAAVRRVSVSSLLGMLVRSNFVLDAEAPLAAHWKSLGRAIRERMGKRGATLD